MRLRAEVTRLATGSAAQAAASAGVAVLSTLWLSPDERGVMVVAATVPALVSVLATLGVGSAYRARRPTTDAVARETLGRAYSALVLGTATLGAVVSVVLGLAAAPLTFPALASGPILAALALAGATLCALSTITDAWFAGGRFGAGARWAAASAVAGLGATLLLHPTSAATFLLTQFLAMSAVLVVSLVPLRRAGLAQRPGIEARDMRSLVREGAPSLGFVAGTTVALRADRLILAAFVSPAVVAAYALASTVSEVVRIVPTAVGQVALHRGAQDPTVPVDDLRRKAAMLVGVAAVLVLPAAALAIPLAFGSAYGSSSTLLAVMLVGEIFFSSYLVTGMNLIGRGTARRAAAVALVGAPLCLLFYAAGASVGGALGCATAGVGLYASLAVLVGRVHAPQPQEVP